MQASRYSPSLEDSLDGGRDQIETSGTRTERDHRTERGQSSLYREHALERKGRGKSIHVARVRCRWGAFLLFKGSWPIFRAHQLLLRGRNCLCIGIPAQQTHSLQGFET